MKIKIVSSLCAKVAVRQIASIGNHKAVLLPDDYGNVGDHVCVVRKDERTIIITKGT